MRISIIPPLLVLTIAAGAFACDKNEGGKNKAEPAQAGMSKTDEPAAGSDDTPEMKPTKATPTLPVHMQDHFTQAAKARDAVITGDLQAMRKPAEWLAKHELSDTLPETWKPHIADMQNAGQLALDAQNVEAAAIAVSHMAQACGECHAALSGPKFSGESPSGEESSTLADMQRHRWAAERMWEGLIGPSDAAWNAGVAALVDAPLHPEAMSDTQTLPKEIHDLAEAAHEAAKKGQEAEDLEARAKQYAKFLSTCSGCHEQLEVKVRPSAQG